MSRSRVVKTIRDVAKAAGVSVSTVSRVLNNKDDVSEETSRKVQSVIKKLGYTSSLAAKSMRSHKANIIGLVVSDVSAPYCVQVMKGIDQAIRALSVDLIIYTGGDTHVKISTREQRYVSLLINGITDGVIVVAPTASTFPSASPIVVIDPNKANPNYPSVIALNREGALDGMAYLIGLGHRRIGFISGRSGLQSSAQRLQGYKEGLHQANIQLDPQLIQEGDYTQETGFLCAQRLLSLPTPPTAIFAANDQSAYGVLDAARAAGLCVPADLSVMGFDNNPPSAYCDPPLTTIDQFIEKIGLVATEMLMELIADEGIKNRIHTIPTELVIRGSCRALQP
jgi:LacI family transcriptional regulator